MSCHVVILLAVPTTQQHLGGQPVEQNSDDVILCLHSPSRSAKSRGPAKRAEQWWSFSFPYWPLSNTPEGQLREQNTGDVILWRHLSFPYWPLSNTSGASLEKKTSDDVIFWRHSLSNWWRHTMTSFSWPYWPLSNTSGVSLDNRTVVTSFHAFNIPSGDVIPWRQSSCATAQQHLGGQPGEQSSGNVTPWRRSPRSVTLIICGWSEHFSSESFGAKPLERLLLERMLLKRFRFQQIPLKRPVTTEAADVWSAVCTNVYE